MAQNWCRTTTIDDVFFDYGIQFIRDSVREEKPFFAYISTNAPHGPLHCPQKYMDLYPGRSKAEQAYYGMISNIDDNVGRTRRALEELKITNNTIFIFTTDNGTTLGRNIFNAGMKGSKGSEKPTPCALSVFTTFRAPAAAAARPATPRP